MRNGVKLALQNGCVQCRQWQDFTVGSGASRANSYIFEQLFTYFSSNLPDNMHYNKTQQH